MVYMPQKDLTFKLKNKFIELYIHIICKIQIIKKSESSRFEDSDFNKFL